MHAMIGRQGLDLHPDDAFWCTPDPGWVTRTSCGIIAPLVNGVTKPAVEAEFDAATRDEVLEKERVTVWYTAPTAIRMMEKPGAAPLAGRDLSALRFMASGGEPMTSGELALRAGWPSMMRGYLHEEARYAKCLVDGCYLTGDLSTLESDER